jgi:hypothetical protein
MRGIQPRAEYQRERRHSQVSNGSLKNLNPFRFHDYLHDDGFAENCISGQIAVLKENQILGLFGWDSSPELNTKKLDNSPSFPLVTYTASTV